MARLVDELVEGEPGVVVSSEREVETGYLVLVGLQDCWGLAGVGRELDLEGRCDDGVESCANRRLRGDSEVDGAREEGGGGGCRALPV